MSYNALNQFLASHSLLSYQSVNFCLPISDCPRFRSGCQHQRRSASSSGSSRLHRLTRLLWLASISLQPSSSSCVLSSAISSCGPSGASSVPCSLQSCLTRSSSRSTCRPNCTTGWFSSSSSSESCAFHRSGSSVRSSSCSSSSCTRCSSSSCGSSGSCQDRLR